MRDKNFVAFLFFKGPATAAWSFKKDVIIETVIELAFAPFNEMIVRTISLLKRVCRICEPAIVLLSCFFITLYSI